MDNFYAKGVPRYKLRCCHQCPPCRRLSAIVVLLSLGCIQRYAIDSKQAHRLPINIPDWKGQLVLISHEKYWLANDVFRAVQRAIITIYWHYIKRILKPLTKIRFVRPIR